MHKWSLQFNTICIRMAAAGLIVLVALHVGWPDDGHGLGFSSVGASPLELALTYSDIGDRDSAALSLDLVCGAPIIALANKTAITPGSSVPLHITNLLPSVRFTIVISRMSLSPLVRVSEMSSEEGDLETELFVPPSAPLSSSDYKLSVAQQCGDKTIACLQKKVHDEKVSGSKIVFDDLFACNMVENIRKKL